MSFNKHFYVSQKDKFVSMILAFCILFIGAGASAQGVSYGGGSIGWSQGWSMGIFRSLGGGFGGGAGGEGGIGGGGAFSPEQWAEAIVDRLFAEAFGGKSADSEVFVDLLQAYNSDRASQGKYANTEPTYRELMDFIASKGVSVDQKLAGANLNPDDVMLAANESNKKITLSASDAERIADINQKTYDYLSTRYGKMGADVIKSALENGCTFDDSTGEILYNGVRSNSYMSDLQKAMTGYSISEGSQTTSITGPDYEGAEKFLNSIKGRGLAESEVAKGLASFGFECTNGICKEAGTNRVATGDSSGSKADINSRYFWATEGACLDGPNLGSIGSGAEETLSGSPSCSGGGGGGTPTAPACTSYTYSDWSACVDNIQTRSIKTKSPSGCSDSSSAVLTQSCVSPISPVVENRTEANQKSSRPLLAVDTNRRAFCQFNENGGFAYPAGINFDTTGGYVHSAQLPESANGAKTYYVICKDSDTGGMSDALKVEFTVSVDSAPVIASITPAEQTGANPVLAVTTDRPAICQYQKDQSFIFGSGAPLSTADNYSHTVSVANLSDEDHLFYVICKNNSTSAISAPKQIATRLRRQGVAGAPVITNTTAVAQAVGNPVLSISTNIAAICQYQNTPFAYGQGAAFSGDNDKKIHQAQLTGLANGLHTYHVICKSDTAEAHSEAMVIMFVVNAGPADVCADLSANDRRNDANRSYWGGAGGDSTYLWQAVETGTRDKFEKVDWRAGYQFTPEKNGKLNQLCGNFAAGTDNQVFLYDGSYRELASVKINGADSWRCADISPVEVKTDKRYYVIARVEDNPIYFEYKSGMLPKRSGGAVIEAGVRQSSGQDEFGKEVRKYDYMIFGLVDARVLWSPQILTGPTIVSFGPSGNVSGNTAVLSIKAASAVECRFGREDAAYGQMSYLMGKTAGNDFAQKVCDLESGTYTFYVRCKDAGGAENNGSTAINFIITQ